MALGWFMDGDHGQLNLFPQYKKAQTPMLPYPVHEEIQIGTMPVGIGCSYIPSLLRLE